MPQALSRAQLQAVLVASAHFYAKKTQNPRGTLLEALANRTSPGAAACPSLVVWGGDCNEVYRDQETIGGYFCTAPGMGRTRKRGNPRP